MVKLTQTKNEYLQRIRPKTRIKNKFAFKVKREHIVKINTPNLAYGNQHIDNEIPHFSKYHCAICHKSSN